jgi:hypothetical protein
MLISTKTLKPIEWSEKEFEVIGTVGDRIRVCVLTPELKNCGWKTICVGVIPTGRWIIRYSFQNQNGKQFGEYANSLAEAKKMVTKFLEVFLTIVTEGAS